MIKWNKNTEKILRFLDNATSHLETHLTNIKIIFLPTNTAGHCQPLDQDIIKNFKHFYRQTIIRRLLSVFKSSSPLGTIEKSITVLDAIVWTNSAWTSIKTDTIKNCFHKAGFPTEDYSDGYDPEDEITLAALFTRITDETVNTEERQNRWKFKYRKGKCWY